MTTPQAYHSPPCRQCIKHEAEIERLKKDLSRAIRFLKEAKMKWRPHTTNSDVDVFLSRHKQAVINDRPAQET